ncbi:hypothetical protein TNCV_1959931 [Trichonephila clavipes]|nr:hypothetical protein TNCV_1959931 [Trichonephila clavipes]
MPAHTLTRNDPVQPEYVLHVGSLLPTSGCLWVLKIPSLEKDASSVNNTVAAKRDLKFVAANTTVKRPDEVQKSHSF